MSGLVVDDVRVAYGRTDVLFGVSLEVPDGSLVCVMGRNGVGKTTLLNTIAGLLKPQSGSVTFDGGNLAGVGAHQRARLGLGYVPQGHAVFPQLTTRENLQVVMERQGRRARAASLRQQDLDEVLDLFPALTTLMNRPAGLLSGGQAKQLAIARALVTGPRLLVLDEPTEGIQPSIIHEIEDTIAKLHKAIGMTILLVEQYVEFALRLADRYAVLDAGRVVSTGLTSEADPSAFAELLAV
ncbi:MAG: urea ABC transporter ATP-binding subunit UrtE [Acidimicrobiales bacterium]